MEEKEPKLCDEKWREEFDKFVNTGNAKEEFLKHLDECSVCRAAENKEFIRQTAEFERFAEVLRQEIKRDWKEEKQKIEKEYKKERRILYLLLIGILVVSLGLALLVIFS